MKRTVMTVLITFVMTLLLLGGSRSPVPSRTAEAQSGNPKSDLMTALRQDSNAMFTTIQTFRGHRAEYVARNVNFVSGDQTGSNAGAGFTADDVDQMVVDMKTICDAIENGGTISVGVWGNVIKIK